MVQVDPCPCSGCVLDGPACLITGHKTPAQHARDAREREARAERRRAEAPAFSGDGGGATDQQLQMLFELSGIKGVTEAELMQGVSHGELTHFDQLSRDDARAIIDKLKSL